MDNMKQYIEALKNGNGFDWIANYGFRLDKYELIDIIKELDYAIYDNLDECDMNQVYKAASDELTERLEDDEEEEQ